MKSYLIIFTNSPFGSFKTQEALDLSLAFSAFEAKVSMLFLNEGVLNLVDDLDGVKNLRKNFTKILSSLDIYDIESIYVDNESMEKYNISNKNFISLFRLISRNRITELIENHDVVFNF